jgi:hypothetical protein
VNGFYRMITNVNRGVANDCMVIVGWIFCIHCFGYNSSTTNQLYIYWNTVNINFEGGLEHRIHSQV